ncbi:hypothetical protein TKK_0015842 [Trichogramma kaykai]|uniref:MIF4G domain-containing protein n=1 Tax=Trichogramma kaykai TaxID=54128 RepID=A0ABD2W8R8_9HYME
MESGGHNHPDFHDAAEPERYTGGGRGRGRGLRPNDQDQPPLLRRPHQQASAPGNDSEVVRTSILSPEAAEFVPKSFTSSASGNRSSVQDRLQLARAEQNVHHTMVQRHHQQSQHQHFNWQSHGQTSQYYQHQIYPDMGYQNVQYQQMYNQHYPSHAQDYNQYDSGAGDYDDKYMPSSGANDINSSVMQLENAMKTLTMNPGKFDSLVPHLVDTVSPFLEDASHCEKIFNLIIQQSINEMNFRYSGARLCTHLDTVVLATESNTSVFRDTLIKICKDKSEEQSAAWQQITKHTDDVEKKCHGLIFFLAELVTQMELEPATALGRLLTKLISTILQNPGPNSAKNVCQALKLAGQKLERDNRTDMEQVMRKLSDLVIEGKVDQNVGRMVTSVSELRSGNWGAVSSQPSSEVVEEPKNLRVTNDTVFYGPDGQILSEEESRFLASANREDSLIQDQWENDKDNDPLAEAYEEYLHDSENPNHNNVQSNSRDY